jgi:hypothetical protein
MTFKSWPTQGICASQSKDYHVILIIHPIPLPVTLAQSGFRMKPWAVIICFISVASNFRRRLRGRAGLEVASTNETDASLA